MNKFKEELKNQRDRSTIFSLVPKNERILYISNRISNRKLAKFIRILFFLSMLFIFDFFFCLTVHVDFFYQFSFLFRGDISIDYPFIFYGLSAILVGYFFGKKWFNYRKDYYLILSEDKVFSVNFSAEHKFPVLLKIPLNKFQYYTIKKRFFGNSYNLVFYNLADEIYKSKFKRINDINLLQKYLDSIFFHFGDLKDQWLIKAKYNLPITLDILKDEYNLIKRRLKRVYLFFVISIALLSSIGIILVIIFDDILIKMLAIFTYLIFTFIIFGILGFIYSNVLYQLRRCSSLTDQMIIKNNEFIINEDAIPFTENSMLFPSYISSRKHTQTPMRPKDSIYCIGIFDNLSSKPKFFGPIVDFKNILKFIFLQLLYWKEETKSLYSIEELYESEMIRS